MVIEKIQAKGSTVLFHDLYAEKFGPILSVAEIHPNAPLPPEIQSHCDEIKAIEGIVIIHPNWWGQPPAILNGKGEKCLLISP